MQGPIKGHLFSMVIVWLSLALTLPVRVSSAKKANAPISAQEITGGVHMEDELAPACSRDGHWLAFEYHEHGWLNYPHVGILDLSQNSHHWTPLLTPRSGRHLYAGDFSWSPDSRWLALITDYPDGKKNVWSESNRQVVKVNIFTHELVKLSNFSPDTFFGPSTAWLRSGLIVFAGDDQNIYGIPENGGSVRKLVDVPIEKCGGVTNTLAVSPDEQSIAFAMDANDDTQTVECNALWVADLRTGHLRRVATAGLHPLTPFWLDENTIFFSGVDIGGGKWVPLGIYSVSLVSERVTRLLDGPYMGPFVCDRDKMLYFSWGSAHPKSIEETWPILKGLSGFHVWKMPLSKVLPQDDSAQLTNNHSAILNCSTPKKVREGSRGLWKVDTCRRT